MTNWEKYKDEIMKVNHGFNKAFVGENILKPKGLECGSMTCCQCTMIKYMWLMEEYKEPSVDWSTVVVDTPILVRNDEHDQWIKRHFSKYDMGFVYAWSNGETSWTADGYTRKWKYAKLAEER